MKVKIIKAFLCFILPLSHFQEKKKWFVCTFVGSILWIAIFSYLMVWWATLAGQTLRIPNEVRLKFHFLEAFHYQNCLITCIMSSSGHGAYFPRCWNFHSRFNHQCHCCEKGFRRHGSFQFYRQQHLRCDSGVSAS